MVYLPKRLGQCCILYKIRNVIQHQNLCNAVFRNIIRNRFSEEPQIDEMGFFIIINHKLRETIGIGILENQKLPLAAARDNRNRLV